MTVVHSESAVEELRLPTAVQRRPERLWKVVAVFNTLCAVVSVVWLSMIASRGAASPGFADLSDFVANPLSHTLTVCRAPLSAVYSSSVM